MFIFVFVLILYFFEEVSCLSKERYLLNQCECKEKRFNAESLSDEITGNFFGTNSSLGVGYDCPTDAKRGFIRLAGTDESGVMGSLNPAFFNENGLRSLWYTIIVFNTKAPSNLAESFKLISFNIDSIQVFVTIDYLSETSLRFIINSNVAAAKVIQNLVVGEEIQIFVGEVNIAFAAGRTFVACIQTSCTFDASAVVANDLALTPITVELLNSQIEFGSDIRIESLAFIENNIDLQVDNIEDLEIKVPTLLASIYLNFEALPIYIDENLVVHEDSTKNIIDVNNFINNTNLNISLNFHLSELEGSYVVLNDSTYEYSPVINAYGSEYFSFSYNSENLPYNCSLTTPIIAIQILPQTDEPSLIYSIVEIQAQSKTNSSFSFEVAHSVDFEDNMLTNGYIVVDNLPSLDLGTLMKFNCTEEIKRNESFQMNGRNFEFCFVGAENVFGATDFTYFVLPPDGDLHFASEQGKVVVKGNAILIIKNSRQTILILVLITLALGFVLAVFYQLIKPKK